MGLKRGGRSAQTFRKRNENVLRETRWKRSAHLFQNRLGVPAYLINDLLHA